MPPAVGPKRSAPGWFCQEIDFSPEFCFHKSEAELGGFERPERTHLPSLFVRTCRLDPLKRPIFKFFEKS